MLPPTYPLTLTVKDESGNITSKTFEVLAAWDVFALLARRPESLQKALLGNYSQDCLQLYWEHMKETSWDACSVVMLQTLKTKILQTKSKCKIDLI